MIKTIESTKIPKMIDVISAVRNPNGSTYMPSATRAPYFREFRYKASGFSAGGSPCTMMSAPAGDLARAQEHRNDENEEHEQFLDPWKRDADSTLVGNHVWVEKYRRIDSATPMRRPET